MSLSAVMATTEQAQRMLELGHRWGTSVRRSLCCRLSQLILDAEHTSNDDTSSSSSISDKNNSEKLDYSTPPSPLASDKPPEKTDPPLPLGRIPDDVYLNLFGFLSARDLCSVRASSWSLQQSEDLHAHVLWDMLLRCDFPAANSAAVASTAAVGPSSSPSSLPVDGPHVQREDHRLPHQQYLKNVLQRATEEGGNLRATQRARESLQTYATKYGGGVIGLVSDLGIIPDQRVARAVSNFRRPAMSSAVVATEQVVYDFRCRGLYSGPLNFLPIRTLMFEHFGAAMGMGAISNALGGSRVPGMGAIDVLPSAPESPAPEGFLGYVVRLIQLRPEHEPLRWTVLFAVFKDLAVFECEAQAKVFKARMPNQRLFYCSLDYPGAQDDPCPLGGVPLPHIGHWGFRPLLADGGGDGKAVWGGKGGVSEVSVAERAQKLERTARCARSALAFLRYGGGGQRSLREQVEGGVEGLKATGTDLGVVGDEDEEQQQAIGSVIHVVYG